MAVRLGGNILVTGANRGIGLELVTQLAGRTGREAHVYAACRDPEGSRTQELKQLISQHSGKITLIKLDMADEDSISAAVQTLTQKIGAGGLNVLINNAAINKPELTAPLSVTEKKDMMEVFETNVAGPFILTKMLLPLLQKAARNSSSDQDLGDEMSCRRSAVINVSSIFSSMELCPQTFTMAKAYPYRTSKTALNMLTRCLAEDWKTDRILLVGIHPGWVQTDLGGGEASLTTQESVLGVLNVMSTLSSKDAGMLLDWQGSRIPW